MPDFFCTGRQVAFTQSIAEIFVVFPFLISIQHHLYGLKCEITNRSYTGPRGIVRLVSIAVQ